MSATTNIVLFKWDEPSKAYEAFSKLRDLNSDYVRVKSLAVVERDAKGQLQVTDDQDNVLGLASLGGGSLGALIGILGGPLGVLLGFASGALVGSAYDMSRGFDSDSIVSDFSRALPPGKSGLIAEIEEATTEEIDNFAKDHGATIDRRSEDEVLDEIAAAEDAADAAADAADKAVRDAKRAERKEKRTERVAAFKKKLGIDS